MGGGVKGPNKNHKKKIKEKTELQNIKDEVKSKQKRMWEEDEKIAQRRVKNRRIRRTRNQVGYRIKKKLQHKNKKLKS